MITSDLKKLIIEIKFNEGDAHNITAPPADGNGGTRAMKACLRDSSLQPKQIEHINCHATSTAIGDPVEILAIYNVFREHTAKLTLTAVKGATGHTLGATGAIESIFLLCTCHYGLVPPIRNLEQLDPQIDKLPVKPQFITGRAVEWNTPKRVALKNAFGFGGTNACIAFSNFLE